MSSDICALSRFLLVFFLCCNDRKKWAEITMYLIESQKKECYQSLSVLLSYQPTPQMVLAGKYSVQSYLWMLVSVE